MYNFFEKFKTNILKDFERLLQESRQVLILTHTRPDGDAVGAAAALKDYLVKQDKQATIFAKGGVNDNCKFIKYADGMVEDLTEELLDEIDLIVCVDASNIDFTGAKKEIENLRNRGVRMVMVDHHAASENEGDVNLIDSSACATTSIIFRAFEEWNFAVDKEIANALLLGIVGDTNNFTNGATNQQAFEIASRLVGCGAQYQFVVKQTEDSAHHGLFRFWSQVLSRILKNDKINIAYSVVLANDLNQTDEVVAEGMANFFNYLSDAEVMMLLKENRREEIKVSLRSKGKVDVQKLAVAFGGGGHSRAAGFTVKGRLEKEGRGWKVI